MKVNQRAPALSAAPTPAPEAPVRLRVYYEDGSVAPVEVELPRSAFLLKDGLPVGLAGPNVRVDVRSRISLGQFSGDPEGAPLETDSRIAPNVPDGRGHFVGPDTDLAQNTTFYAATQVHALATRGAGRPVTWGPGGVLTIHPYASVGASLGSINAEADPDGHRLLFHSFGSVRGGRAHGFDGRFPELEAARRALELQLAAVTQTKRGAQRYAPVFAERERAFRAALEQVRAALATPDRDTAARALTRALEALGEPTPQREGPTPPSPSGAPRAACPKPDGGPAGRNDADEPPPDPRLRRAPARLRDAERAFSAFTVALATAVGEAREGLAGSRVRSGDFLSLAHSREVSAHEAGHAVLDGLKPFLSQSFTGAALHEAYGDSVAVLTAFDHDAAVAAVLRETGGDLRRANRASRISEEFEAFMRRVTLEGEVPRVSRDVSELVRLREFPGYGHADREPRPGECGPADLSQHRVGQTFSGIVYGLFAEAATRAAAEVESEADKIARVRAVRDEVSGVLHRALVFLPESGGTPDDFARALLEADRRSTGGRYAEAIRREARARDLLPPGTDERVTLMRRVPAVIVPASLKGRALSAQLTSGSLGRALGRPFDELQRNLRAARVTPAGGLLGAVAAPRVREDVVDRWGNRTIRLAAQVALRAPQPGGPQSIEMPVLTLVLDPRGRPIVFEGPAAPSAFASPGAMLRLAHGGGRCSCH